MRTPATQTTLKIAGAALSVLVLATCGEPGVLRPNEKAQTVAVSVSPSSSQLYSLGETVQLTATAVEKKGRPIPDATYIWTSSDESVATVSPSGLVTAVANGPVTIWATASGVDGSAAVDVEQRVAGIRVSPAAATLTAIGASKALAAAAEDALGNEVPGVAFTWSSSDGSVANVDANGVATSVGNGSAAIRASAHAASGIASLSVSQAAHNVTVSPASASFSTLGETQHFTAVATDANGVEIENAQFVWTSSDEAVAQVDANGVATSVGQGSATISASIQGVPGQALLEVHQVVTGLSFSIQPSGAAAGEAIAPAIQVEVVDANGGRVEDASLSVSVDLVNTAAGTLSGTRAAQVVSGVATFDDLWVDRAGDHALVATASGLGSATSAPFTIRAGAPVRLAFGGQPADAMAGASLGSVTVSAEDQFGNQVTDFADAVDIAFHHNPTGAVIGGTTQAAASGGLVTFGDLYVEKAGSSYTLEASSGALAAVVSAAFDVTPGPMARLGFVTEPPAVAEGQEPFEVQVVVQDEFGNMATNASGEISVALGSNPSGDALAGTHTIAPVNGVATFDDLSIALPASGYTLQATAPGLSSTTTAAFDVRLTFAEEVGGAYFTCGVTVANHAYCWGQNHVGQLGDGTAIQRVRPRPVVGGHRFRQLAAGEVHACGVTTDDIALCWGYSANGRLGNGDASSSVYAAPDTVAGGLTFHSVSAGWAHTCALASDRTAYCWGYNPYGQVGDGSTSQRSVPTAVAGGSGDGGDGDGEGHAGHAAGPFTSIVSGSFHSCAVDFSGDAWCWGRGNRGQLGHNSTGSSTIPVAVSGGYEFVALAAGGQHTCGMESDGTVRCWGYNGSGQLGDGTTTDRRAPSWQVSVSRAVRIAGGDMHSCLTTSTGVMECWGHGSYGQLGNGATTSQNTRPVTVSGGLSFGSLTTGSYHACGRTASGVKCWGQNTYGQLGNGTQTTATEPAAVLH